MKNSLTSPKFPAIFKRYAPLLQGGLMKISMLFGIILLCGFTMFRFLHTQLQGMNEVFGAENVRTISMVVGALIGAGTITHFAGLLPLLIRDFIQLWKEQKDKDEKRVHTGVLIINSLIVVAILCFDGYVSTTGIKNAVADMGEDIADSRFNAEKSTYEGNFSAAEGKVIQAWRTDSINIESLYGGKIKGLKEKSSGEIGALRGKASRGEAAGSTSWAASLRSIASNKNSQMETKIAEFEAQKAEDLLLRAQQRDKDLSIKEGDKSSGIVAAKGKGDKMENRFKRYGGMTWVLSLGLYLIYIGTCIKHELIHFGAGIENEVEVAERYFRPGFMQNLVHELGNWAHDLGRLITNFLAKKRLAWSEKLREKAYLPLDAGDVYRQEVDFSAALATNHRAEQMAERGQSVEEPYKQTGKIGFGASYLSETRTQPQTPQLPPKPPVLTEVIAPCENEFPILSSNLRTGKTEMPIFSEISKEKLEISNLGFEISKGNPEISKKYLSYTQTGISKIEAQMRFRQKVGAVKASTYQKNMESISKAKEVLRQKTGQLALWL